MVSPIGRDLPRTSGLLGSAVRPPRAVADRTSDGPVEPPFRHRPRPRHPRLSTAQGKSGHAREALVPSAVVVILDELVGTSDLCTGPGASAAAKAVAGWAVGRRSMSITRLHQAAPRRGDGPLQSERWSLSRSRFSFSDRRPFLRASDPERAQGEGARRATMEGRARAMTKPPPRRACTSRPVVASRSVPCQVATELLQRLVVVVVASGAGEAASAAAPAVGVEAVKVRCARWRRW
jgi:hypothetical protein